MPERKNEKILGTAGTDIVFLPILVFKTEYQDFSSALARCVNKLVVIEINADMGERFAIGIEENQIAECTSFFEITGKERHLFYCARQGMPCKLSA